MILHGPAACARTGIPELHAQAFQQVANDHDTLIMSRAVGIYATGLILEGYASKGFHNKAKSCNWGPMAGFVLDDPRFTKVGGTDRGREDQARALRHAIDEGAVEVPLHISEARRQWLMANKLVQFVDRDSDSYRVDATSPWGLSLAFRLERSRPEGASEKMWAVLYRRADRQSARTTVEAGPGEWTPVMALRDPLCELPVTDYRAATTGDYDLFAVWARSQAYRPDSDDRRRIGHRPLEAAIRAGLRETGEDPHLGNITHRIALLRNALNTAFKARGYRGGNMVHHSDEGGRPFVSDIDLPVFAVVPGRAACYGLTEVPDLRQFITAELDRRFAPVFNPGWMRQLVFQPQASGRPQNPADLARATALRDDLLRDHRARLRPVPR